MIRCQSKVIYQKCPSFTNFGNDYSLRDKKESIPRRLQITKIYVEDFFFFQNFEVIIIALAIGSLLYLTPS